MAARRILVTGGNSGIGFALCKQLAVDHGCVVYLGSRDVARGATAVDAIMEASPGAAVELVQIDVGSDESVKAASEEVKVRLGSEPLFAIVNNAGCGLAHGVPLDTVVNVNLRGPKRVCDAFIPLLGSAGRVVNVGSGAGPKYVAGCAVEVQKVLCSPDTTWEQLEAHLQSPEALSEGPPNHSGYGVSKAALATLTMMLAKTYPDLKINCLSPGFIATNIVKGFGATKAPEEGTVSIKKCLFEELEGNGRFYGSDGLRSPLHFLRNPGEPEFDGVMPF